MVLDPNTILRLSQRTRPPCDPYRDRQCVRYAPSDPKPMRKAIDGYTDMVGPFFKGFTFSVMRDVSAACRMLVLLLACGPSAVVKFVVAIVINAVNRVLWSWSRPHIIKKRLKRVSPLVAHRDASPAIMTISGVVRVATSKFHALPGTILVRAISSVGSNLISVQASTATSMAACKPGGLHRDNVSARTQAVPVYLSRSTRGLVKDFQSFICMSSSVNEVRHERRLQYSASYVK